MIYRLCQETLYSYAGPVPFSRHIARMLPTSRTGQRVVTATLAIDPTPSERRQSIDFFGNRVTHFALDRSHDRLTVRLDAEIAEVTPVPSDPVGVVVHDLNRPTRRYPGERRGIRLGVGFVWRQETASNNGCRYEAACADLQQSPACHA